MTSNFVTLSEQEFTEWAKNNLASFDFTTPKQGRELVIVTPLTVQSLEIHIYTSIEPSTNATRGKGEDAIRIILYDRLAGKPVSAAVKVLRVEGQTTVFDRLSQRVVDLTAEALRMERSDQFCKCTSQRVHSIKRTNSRTGQVFFGCSLFPHCDKAGFNKLQHAAVQYPLKLNPLAEHLPVEKPLAVENHEQPVERIKITGDFKKWPIDPEAALVSTEEFAYVDYPFENFNCVQSVVFKSDVWRRDVNLILGTATSSGKTICAEMAIAAALMD